MKKNQWCQNVRNAKLSVFKHCAKLSWRQIVWCCIAIVPNLLGAKLSSTKLSCCQIVWCQIVWCQISLVPFVAFKANCQYIFLFTTHIFHIFAFDTHLQYLAFSYISIICSLHLHRFSYDSQIDNV